MDICNIVSGQADINIGELKARCVRASDVAPHCREVLCSLDVDNGPCVFGDMTERMPTALKAQLEPVLARFRTPSNDVAVLKQLGNEFVEEAAKILAKHFPSDPHLKLHCSKHFTNCLVHKDSKRGSCTLMIAGVSCIDYTSMGKRRGVIGEGAMPFLTLVHEIREKRYGISIIECTPAFNHKQLERLLGPGFGVQYAVFSPLDIGHLASRTRKYTVVLNEENLEWLVEKELTTKLFLDEFGCAVQTIGSVYMTKTSQAAVDRVIGKMARMKHLTARDGQGCRWPMRRVLSPGYEFRLKEHEAKVGDKHSDLFCYLCQSTKYGGATSHIPALLRKSQIWSMGHKRLLLPEEHCRVMGMRFTPAMEDMKDSHLRSLAGNAMHSAAFGCILLYTFANTIPAFQLHP